MLPPLAGSPSQTGGSMLSDVAVQVNRLHQKHRSFHNDAPQAPQPRQSRMLQGDAGIAAAIAARSASKPKLARALSEVMKGLRKDDEEPPKWPMRRLTQVFNLEVEEEPEPEPEPDEISEGDGWLTGCSGLELEEDRALLAKWASRITLFEGNFEESLLAYEAKMQQESEKAAAVENGASMGGTNGDSPDGGNGNGGGADAHGEEAQERQDGESAAGVAPATAVEVKEEIPMKVLELRARQLLNCVEEIMYDAPPERMAARGFKTDACGMNVVVSLKKISLVLSNGSSDLAQISITSTETKQHEPHPETHAHHAHHHHGGHNHGGIRKMKHFKGFQFIYNKTRRLKSMELKAARLALLDQRPPDGNTSTAVHTRHSNLLRGSRLPHGPHSF